MTYFHDDVQRAEAKIKEHLPTTFIEKSDRGFGLSVYRPTLGTTIVYQRAGPGRDEVIANLDAVIAKYRDQPREDVA